MWLQRSNAAVYPLQLSDENKDEEKGKGEEDSEGSLEDTSITIKRDEHRYERTRMAKVRLSRPYN